MFLPERITFLNDWVMVLTDCTCITLQIVWFVFLPNSCFLLNWLYSYQPGSGNIVLKCINLSCVNFVMIFFLSCFILFVIYVDRLVIISFMFYCISLISTIIQFSKNKDIFHLNHYLYLLIQIVLNIFWINWTRPSFNKFKNIAIPECVLWIASLGYVSVGSPHLFSVTSLMKNPEANKLW